MLEKKVSHIHEDSRYLNHKEHDAEHHDEVHKIECLIKGHCGDDVVSDCLVVKCSLSLYYHCYEEEIYYEESTSCY